MFRKITLTCLLAVLITISVFTYASSSSADDEWEYYLGSQREDGFDDSRDRWQRLLRKNTATGEKQQLTSGCVYKYIVLDNRIIYSEYSGDYMDGARQGETYGLHSMQEKSKISDEFYGIRLF